MHALGLHISLDVRDFDSNHAYRTLEKAVASLKLRQIDTFNIQTILNELITNALDHGLLSLDSAQKSEPSGFVAYYEMRSEKIKQGIEGQIDVHISHEHSHERHRLHIHVVDTGKGFDTSSIDADSTENNFPFGRGICITRRLCISLLYSPRGNEVHAIYELEH